jgi:hypothetical protein
MIDVILVHPLFIETCYGGGDVSKRRREDVESGASRYTDQLSAT